MERRQRIFADDRLPRELLAVAALPDVDDDPPAIANRVCQAPARCLPANRHRVHARPRAERPARSPAIDVSDDRLVGDLFHVVATSVPERL